MIRVQIDEWVPEKGEGEDVECAPRRTQSSAQWQPKPGSEWVSGKLIHRRMMLLQDFEVLDVTQVVALLNGLATVNDLREVQEHIAQTQVELNDVTRTLSDKNDELAKAKAMVIKLAAQVEFAKRRMANKKKGTRKK